MTTGDERAQEIKAALDAFEEAVEIDKEQFSSASALRMFQAEKVLAENERDWLIALLAENAALKAYIDELEMIIYHNVSLSGIMSNGDSEETYHRINAKMDAQINEAWERLKGHADE